MRFEWAISLGHVLNAGLVLLAIASAAWKLRDELRDIRRLMQDFPPHRHVNSRIIYPAGMKPEEANEIGAAGPFRRTND